MPSYKLQKDGSFLIKDYNQASPFSNFLPGIAGVWGMPLWAFYLNRGQALSSFGLKDKNGAISEFYPANKAYSLTPSFGFRTFIKDSRNIFYEPFSLKKDNPRVSQTMRIDSGYLEIIDQNSKFGLETSVKYFTLPNQPVACLVRKVTFKNISNKALNLKVLDGLARIIPYGAANNLLKDMSRTLEAWMHASLKENIAFFRLIVDPADVSQTNYIQGANFNHSFYFNGSQKIYPRLLVDPEIVFGNNLSYTAPDEFIKKSFNPAKAQIFCGKTPSAFSSFNLKLEPGCRATLYNLFGASFSSGPIQSLAKRTGPSFLKEKEAENSRIILSIKKNAFCLSGSDSFNHYLGSSYLDNILRGGFPYKPAVGSNQNISPYYIFSRKHGDPERDYNYFNLSPSFFSEGESNYRDLNQNRRMDLFFEPCLKEDNITYFLNLIQIDGYNPLVAKGQKLYLESGPAQAILKKYLIKKKKFLHLMIKGFYLGEFLDILFRENEIIDKEGLVSLILKQAQRKAEAFHGQGYWIDHWRYCLDLIESFLNFYPDRLKSLFFDTEFTFFDDKYKIKPRRRRYFLRKGCLYQGESIEADKDKAQILKKRKKYKNILRTEENKIYRTNLIEKLLVLILNKAASFDPDGLGIEMEADKPGWCDSLNGLPALLGSSLCETFELKRAALILKGALGGLKEKPFALGPDSIKLSKNVYNFFLSFDRLLKSFHGHSSKNKDFTYWDEANRLKENFRKNSFYFLSGKKITLKIARLESFLESLIRKIDKGLAKAEDKKTKLYPTYFVYQAVEYKKINHHPQPLKFKGRSLPLFLEAIVHALRTFNAGVFAYKNLSRAGRKKVSLRLYNNVRNSLLYDQKLKMYKLNSSLASEPLDIGRSRVFTPGWLENESIWLHMEYKYLLELLKAGLYQEFFGEFNNCLVCFQDPKTYGRSILENSSFLVSSCHPDKNLHGKGFVARLTGATAELINIWIVISLGLRPFYLNKKGFLVFSPKPVLKADLFTSKARLIDWLGEKIKIPKDTYSFSLFSRTLVIYHNPKRLDTFSSQCRVSKIELLINKKLFSFTNKVEEEFASLIRAQKVEKIDVYLS